LPLPERPALDALLVPQGLTWNDAAAHYQRPGEVFSSHHTEYSTLDPAQRTSLPRHIEAPDAADLTRHAFHDRLRDAVERGGLRILGVTADRALDAELALSHAFGLQIKNFDRLFTAELHRQIAARNVRADIYQADLQGPAQAKSWTGLTRLAGLAAAALSAKIFPPARPILITQPGLMARYGLRDFLAAMVAASHQPEAAAIFLLVPGHDTGGVPRINGHMDIPGILATQALWVPHSWLAHARAGDSLFLDPDQP
jgi:hypothetical protein